MPTGDDVTTGERARLFVASNFALVVAGCLLLAAAGGYVAYQTHTAPDTTTEQREVTTWTAEDDFEHAAVVRRDTRAFDAGAVLRNRSTYFSAVAPVLNGSYVVTHGGDAEPATVETDLRLVVSAVSGGDEGQVLWDVTEPLATERTESLSPGEQFRVPYRVNVTEQSVLAERVREELGSTRGQTEVLLVAETTVETTAAGQAVSDERTARLSVVPTTDAYSVTRELEQAASDPITEPVTVPVEPDPLAAYGSLVALVVGLLGAAAVGWADHTGRLDVSPETRAALDRQRERDSFDEWISVGRVPPVSDDRSVVTIDSLAGLVDVAIDSERRVVEDADSGVFVVLDGETRYEFQPTAPQNSASAGEEWPDGPAGNGDGAATDSADDHADDAGRQDPLTGDSVPGDPPTDGE